MKVFISGILGTGMGPLALIAKDAGIEVAGSDLAAGMILPEIEKAGIPVAIGEQDGGFLREFADGSEETWFVRTAALPEDAAEMRTARELGLRISKRDELISELVERLGLKMVAVAGTHGKTTTTGMIIWACLRLNLPAAYLVGTTLGFAEAGRYREGDRYFIYEADEYDRNFLHFRPWVGVITSVSYDHPDIYPTVEDYESAFKAFEKQSLATIRFGGERPEIGLSGPLRRIDAAIAYDVVKKIADDTGVEMADEAIFRALNEFPGIGRRFERIATGVYSDYGHHPEEIAATIEMAREEAARAGLAGVVAVYEPHQNTRQHGLRQGYKTAFLGADKLFWLPTYLTRENPDLPVIAPEEFLEGLQGPAEREAARPDGELAEKLRRLREQGYLILLMTAGPADGWLREVFAE